MALQREILNGIRRGARRSGNPGRLLGYKGASAIHSHRIEASGLGLSAILDRHASYGEL
jgi:hypothetical protein